MIIGIAMQGLAECFLSPKFLEFASKQAPKGEVGLYLGYQHLTTFFAWLAGFIAAGLLLDRYCPDPRTLDPPTRHEWRLATEPKYRFTLDPADTAALETDGALPLSVRDALERHDLAVGADATLRELKPRDWWRADPERSWVIDVPVRTVPESELPAELRSELEDGKTVSDGLRATLESEASPIPAEAYLRRLETSEGKPRWDMTVRPFEIVEAKLETDAEAHKAGRERARRDVLVLADASGADEPSPLPEQYAHADRIWYAFAIIGFTAFAAMLGYIAVTNRLDRRSPSRDSDPTG
jgi:hypothetical protein